jgi:hypothetical protein
VTIFGTLNALYISTKYLGGSVVNSKSLLAAIVSLLLLVGLSSHAETFSSPKKNQPTSYNQLSDADQMALKRNFYDWLMKRDYLGSNETETAKNILNEDSESLDADLKILPCAAQKKLLFGLIIDAKNSLSAKETKRAIEIKSTISENCNNINTQNINYEPKTTYGDDDSSYDQGVE